MSFVSAVGLIFLFSCCSLSVHGIGDFWFVTDFHVDQNYSRTGNPANLCHAEASIFQDAGLYGNFLCDSPLSLMNASIKAMKFIQPNPDFIIWTGDNLPHTENVIPDWNIVFQALKNISDSLHASFPNVPVFPSIGNHDTFPPNILFPNATSNGVYEGFLKKGGWDKFLSENACLTFKQGGFYSEIIKPGLRLISLNTIIWYFPNKYTEELKDPAGQLEWLKETLKNSSKLAEKVYIIGHVPPGYYNRVNPGMKSDPTFHKHFNEKYLNILHQYSDIIYGQMYGHLHMDLFQLFQYNTGVFKSSSIIASSVTPWHLPGTNNVSLPVNPSVRLMHYSQTDFVLKDYDQFYMNLSKVNSLKQNDSQPTNLFEHLYKFTDAYGVPDLSTQSLLQVFEMLKKNKTVFDTFFGFLTAGKESAPCERDCKIAQLCAMSSTSSGEYDLCMKTVSNTIVTDNTSLNITTNAVITVVLTILLMVLIIVFIIYKKFWKANIWRRRETEYERFMSFD